MSRDNLSAKAAALVVQAESAELLDNMGIALRCAHDLGLGNSSRSRWTWGFRSNSSRCGV